MESTATNIFSLSQEEMELLILWAGKPLVWIPKIGLPYCNYCAMPVSENKHSETCKAVELKILLEKIRLQRPASYTINGGAIETQTPLRRL